ncbi:hypothetical protein TNIN_465231 [Trichonephila inaurata madagascariensis]|uniref:Uncharacterized protein n=1 Tax=Trichonephila inaurata madagascariensis TaxID=2747483 RepID=A0A8X7CTN6_9ARAC|nr:hypothetical protein TNIN_465231 [Trichonephila inaurata madagascariensis]
MYSNLACSSQSAPQSFNCPSLTNEAMSLHIGLESPAAQCKEETPCISRQSKLIYASFQSIVSWSHLTVQIANATIEIHCPTSFWYPMFLNVPSRSAYSRPSISLIVIPH